MELYKYTGSVAVLTVRFGKAETVTLYDSYDDSVAPVRLDVRGALAEYIKKIEGTDSEERYMNLDWYYDFNMLLRRIEVPGVPSEKFKMQGFLFGGLASGAKWNGKTAPEPGDGYGRSVRAYHGSTLAPVCQIDRKTNQVIHEYPSIAAAARATGLDDSAIGKVCKGKLPHAGGFLFRYIEQ